MVSAYYMPGMDRVLVLTVELTVVGQTHRKWWKEQFTNISKQRRYVRHSNVFVLHMTFKEHCKQ
jgi:hypothetical protein